MLIPTKARMFTGTPISYLIPCASLFTEKEFMAKQFLLSMEFAKVPYSELIDRNGAQPSPCEFHGGKAMEMDTIRKSRHSLHAKTESVESVFIDREEFRNVAELLNSVTLEDLAPNLQGQRQTHNTSDKIAKEYVKLRQELALAREENIKLKNSLFSPLLGITSINSMPPTPATPTPSTSGRDLSVPLAKKRAKVDTGCKVVWRSVQDVRTWYQQPLPSMMGERVILNDREEKHLLSDIVYHVVQRKGVKHIFSETLSESMIEKHLQSMRVPDTVVF